MRFRYNPFRGPIPETPFNPSAVRAFHRSLPAYAPTPLHVSPGRIYIKDESARFGLGAFKGLGASWAMRELTGPFSAATAGNHGRAVAWMARLMGARAVIFVSPHALEWRVRAIEAEGAEVRVVSGTYDDAVRECARISAAEGWQVVSDTGYPGYQEIPLRIVEGYRTIFEEFEEQRLVMDLAPPAVVIVQAGVGGLLCAAVQHFDGHLKRPLIVSVEPEEADCLLESISSPDGQPRAARGTLNSAMACLNCGNVSLTAWPTIRAGVDLFLAVEDGYIAPGDSGAAGMAGLLAFPQLQKGPVLLINTEGGQR